MTNINAKIIEILEGYKSRFDFFRPIKTSQLSEAIREFDRQVIASDSFRHQLRLAQEEGSLDKLLQDVRLK